MIELIGDFESIGSIGEREKEIVGVVIGFRTFGHRNSVHGIYLRKELAVIAGERERGGPSVSSDPVK